MTELSPVKVLRSAAGYYLGQELWDHDLKYWAPYSRDSSYFYSRWEAEVEGNLPCNTVDAMIEIDSELIRARKLKHTHKLIPIRVQFLEQCRKWFRVGKMPTLRWNYNVNAKPNDAYYCIEENS